MIVIWGFFHLLPEGVDKEPTKKGEGEVEDDLDDDDIVVQLVDVEEEDHQDAHEVDCKVKGHPDERREDELVFWSDDAEDQQAACHDRDSWDEDVDALETNLNIVDPLRLFQRSAEPWIRVVVVALKIDPLWSCDAVQAFWFYNKTSKKNENVEQVENDRNYGDCETAGPQLQRILLKYGFWVLFMNINIIATYRATAASLEDDHYSFCEKRFWKKNSL